MVFIAGTFCFALPKFHSRSVYASFIDIDQFDCFLPLCHGILPTAETSPDYIVSGA